MKSEHAKQVVSATIIFLMVLASVFALPSRALANSLQISNVNVSSVRMAKGHFFLEFDINWQNSWRNNIDHDAVWVFCKVSVNGETPVHGTLMDSGLNPPWAEKLNDYGVEMYVPMDKRGAFIRRQANGGPDALSIEKVRLKVNADALGLKKEDNFDVFVFGLEMVYIPTGAFYAGDRSSNAGFVDNPGAGANPWLITSEDAINTGDGNHYYTAVDDGNTEFSSGDTFTIPADFPKGYKAFYSMKYEVSEDMWTAFFNTLSKYQKLSRDVTGNSGKNSNNVVNRNTISWSGNEADAVTLRSGRAMGWLSWPDLCAFLDWAALRPMTELEFEKVSRGDEPPLSDEYIWGTTNITAAEIVSGTSEDGSETIVTVNANAAYDNKIFTGGDSASGTNYAQGPLRRGIFATSASGRESAGAGLYGVMDLGGNVYERVITVGNSDGIAFAGEHGDGLLSTEGGYEGNANEQTWPGTDTVSDRGITGALGSGSRGGAWNSPATYVQTSDRSMAVNPAGRNAGSGGRGVRTYDGN